MDYKNVKNKYIENLESRINTNNTNQKITHLW
jgi:hypothetical protein